jgi:xylulokinase
VDELRFDAQVDLPYQCHAVRDKYVVLPYAQTSGIAYKWFRDAFTATTGVNDFEELNRLSASVPPGSEGIVFLPFLAGAHFPVNDSFAKGVFYGITLKHGKAHFSRAIMEAIGFMLKNILRSVKDYGIRPEEIHSMGGGARSDLWLQIKADICDCPIVRMEEEETATLGAAILAAVQVGDYKSLEEAVGAMVKRGRRFEPEPLHRPVYEKNFELYNELCKGLKGIFRRFST